MIILVGGLEHEFYFPFHIWDVILPIDELIFFNRVKTTNQIPDNIDRTSYIMGVILFFFGCFSFGKIGAENRKHHRLFGVYEGNWLPSICYSLRHWKWWNRWFTHKKMMIFSWLCVCLPGRVILGWCKITPKNGYWDGVFLGLHDFWVWTSRSYPLVNIQKLWKITIVYG